MADQSAFEFLREPSVEERAATPAPFPPKRPVIVLRWNRGGVEGHWVDFNIVSWFQDWPTALDLVLHPVNDHVIVKVRA